MSRAPVQPEPLHLGRDGHAARGRPRARPPRYGHGCRTRRQSSGSIENSSTRSGRVIFASTASRAERSVPGRVATPSRASSSTRSGSFHVRKSANSSAPIRNTGSSRRSASSASTVRAYGSSATSASSSGANASSARNSRMRGSVSTSLWPGSATTRTSNRSSRKCRTAASASATCPTCGGSNAPPRIPVAPPTPIRAPRRRSRPASPS